MFNEIAMMLLLTIANPVGEPTHYVLDYGLTETDCAVRLAYELSEVPYNPLVKTTCEVQH